MSETEAVGGAGKWVDDLQQTVKESMDSDLFSCTRTGSGATKPSSLFLSSKKKFSQFFGFAMAVDTKIDLLSERALLMRKSLQKSQTITDNVVSILGSFDSRLSALESAMRPTQFDLLRENSTSQFRSIQDTLRFLETEFDSELVIVHMDFIPHALNQYKTYENAFFSKGTEELRNTKEHSAAAARIGLAAGLVLMRGITYALISFHVYNVPYEEEEDVGGNDDKEKEIVCEVRRWLDVREAGSSDMDFRRLLTGYFDCLRTRVSAGGGGLEVALLSGYGPMGAPAEEDRLQLTWCLLEEGSGGSCSAAAVTASSSLYVSLKVL
ncbi:hypothetical protein Bca101_097356 [Brassica carinata]